MRVDLDAKIRTRDGEDAGRVQRAVIDPERNEITHFLIDTGGLFGRSIMVPREDLERASRDGEVLRLDLTKEQLKQMPDYVPDRYGAPPSGWMPPEAYGYPAVGFLWPMAYNYAYPYAAAAAYPPGLNKDSAVRDRAGDAVGVVSDIRVDSQTGDLQAIVLRASSGFEALFGGGETIEISKESIDRIEDGAVYLLLAKEDLAPLRE